LKDDAVGPNSEKFESYKDADLRAKAAQWLEANI
jgi:hypothetical protein